MLAKDKNNLKFQKKKSNRKSDVTDRWSVRLVLSRAIMASIYIPVKNYREVLDLLEVLKTTHVLWMANISRNIGRRWILHLMSPV